MLRTEQDFEEADHPDPLLTVAEQLATTYLVMPTQEDG
jgi:hypothetical protein